MRFMMIVKANPDTEENDKPRVIDGPFTETKELIAGFWMIQ